jgi:hypothetical protein
MTDDDPGPTPLHYDTAREPAQSRPGPRAPEPASREPVPPARDWAELFQETNHLRATARDWRHDALWELALLDQWLAWERWLQHWEAIYNVKKYTREDVGCVLEGWEVRYRLRIARRFLGGGE